MNKPQGKNRNRRSGGKRGGGRGNYDNRNRGNAQQLMDKYLAMARDAAAGGDRIQAENYYQHADHYFRVLNGRNDPNRQNRDQNQQQPDEQSGEAEVLAVPGSQEAEVVEINAASGDDAEAQEARPSRSARARSRAQAEDAANDATDEPVEEDDAGLQRIVRTRKPRRKPAVEAEPAAEAEEAPADASEEATQPESIPAE